MKESPIFLKTGELALWVFQQTPAFPRRLRHSLTDRIERSVLRFQAQLVRAVRDPVGSGRSLSRADATLDHLRFLFRLAKDLQVASLKSYAGFSERVMEVGRLLGAWRQGSGKGDRPG